MTPSANKRQAWTEWHRDTEKPAKRRTRSQIEHEIQRTFIDWCRVISLKNPLLRLMHAIPNGGQRHPAVAGRLKSEGVLPGVPDLHLPVPVTVWASLYLEVKAPGENPTKHQAERIEELRAVGNVVVVCWSVQELIDTTMAYLNGHIRDVTGNTNQQEK